MHKNIILSTFMLIFGLQLNMAQLITSEPSLPTDQNATTITFDASQGNQGLINFTGDVYAHTGVITNLSTSGSDWKYVIAGWSQNTAKAKMTSKGNNKWELVITPSIRGFYSVPANETIQKMAFVFRSADGTKEGKTAAGGDIFVDVYKAGLAVSITSPATQPYFTDPGANFNIQVEASLATEIKVYIDKILQYTTTSNSYSYQVTAAASGTHWINIEATDGSKTEKDSIYYVVRGTSPVLALPAGLRDGINYIDDNTVTLVLHAPYKNSVYAIGDFNNWEANSNYIMNRTTASTTDMGLRFWITLNGLTKGKEYIYQYLIDENLKIADPYTEKISDPWNDKEIPAETYPSLIAYPYGKTTGIASVFQTAQTAYNWQVTNYIPPKNEDLVIYELLVRDFTAKANYQTLIDTIGYFKRLGINAIELMPTNEFEGNDSWGYNPSFYFAPDKAYGTKNKMKEFIDVCHQNGISVFIDLVLNHSYGQSPFVQMYFENGKPSTQNPWYNVDHNFQNTAAHWGYDFNHNSIYTQKLVDSINSYWINEYKVDGFRFDFTKGFSNTIYGPSDWGSAYDPSRISNLKRMANAIWKLKPDAYISFEHLSDNTEEKELANYGICLWGNMNYNYNEATMGYNESGKSDLSWGSYKTRNWNDPRLVTYMESHDEERLMFKNQQYGNSSGDYEIIHYWTSLSRVEMAACFFFTIPGPKMIWQFGELGYDISIEENGRVGKKPIKWEYYNENDRYRLFQIFSSLIKLKQENDVFETTDYNMSVNGALKWINLNSAGMNVVIVGNFDVKAGDIAVTFQSTGTWYDYFSGTSLEVSNLSQSITLQPGEYHIYTSVQLTKPDVVAGVEPIVKNNGNTAFLKAYPNPATENINIQFKMLKQAENARISIYNLQGQKVNDLYNGKLPQGEHHMEWKLNNQNSRKVPSGVYLMKLEADNIKEKLVLIVR